MRTSMRAIKRRQRHRNIGRRSALALMPYQRAFLAQLQQSRAVVGPLRICGTYRSQAMHWHGWPENLARNVW